MLGTAPQGQHFLRDPFLDFLDGIAGEVGAQLCEGIGKAQKPGKSRVGVRIAAIEAEVEAASSFANDVAQLLCSHLRGNSLAYQALGDVCTHQHLSLGDPLHKALWATTGRSRRRASARSTCRVVTTWSPTLTLTLTMLRWPCVAWNEGWRPSPGARGCRLVRRNHRSTWYHHSTTTTLRHRRRPRLLRRLVRLDVLRNAWIVLLVPRMRT
mmetsp:Transcript_27372/g.59760  ORF Transcript_27372/g.59760 Transcript_27372/m.59760 type:complete len:211 (+) Transcript_27372:768-1400(+)